VKDNKALIADIDKAKSSMNTVANSAGMMSSQEMMSANDLNEWGVQFQLYQLYSKLLSFKVSIVIIL
jgi:short-subunit dehydrogenase involved in D-alanine esterification of teichoic acids